MSRSNETNESLSNLTGTELAMEMLQADSIIFTNEFTPPNRNSFLITKTLELDSYEYGKNKRKSRSDVFMANAVALAATSDNFTGTARKAAKLSIATAAMETFSDLKDLIATLPAAHQAMANHQPRITTSATSDRVSEEKGNKVSNY